MTLYLQGCAAVLLAVVLGLMLGKSQEIGTLLSIGVCAMAAMIAMHNLHPVTEFLQQLQELGNLDGELIGILMKAAGIGILTEISVLVCNDSGNASMGKSVQLLGTAVILWLSLPLFTALVELLQSVLGGV